MSSVQVNEETVFIPSDGRLVSVEEAEAIRKELADDRSLVNLLEEGDRWKLVPGIIREEDYPTFITVASYVLDTVSEYIDIRIEKYDKMGDDLKKRTALSDLRRALSESELLKRMIRGEEVYPVAPPKSYGKYWYDLVEKGEVPCYDVWISYYSTWASGKEEKVNKVEIDNEKWDMIEKSPVAEDVYIVSWPKDPDVLYSLSKMTEEDEERLLHPRLKHFRETTSSSNRYTWKLKRLERTDNE